MKILVTENENFKTFKQLNEDICIPEGSESKKITHVFKHTAQNKWWLSKDNLLHPDFRNGFLTEMEVAINNSITAEDCYELEKTHQELIDEGFLPSDAGE